MSVEEPVAAGAVSAGRPRSAASPDSVAAEAVETARAALVGQVGEDVVGEHVGVDAEGSRLVTHRFASRQPGYPGWQWSVTVARASRQRSVTVDEVVLLPGQGAITAPAWVPWRERIKPGDLSPGDLLPVEEDDPRLVPGYFSDDPTIDPEGGLESDPDALREVSDEVGLGRPRLLSVEGRDLAAQRWYDGDHGPHVELAEKAPAACGSCGFLVRMAGPLSGVFGVCANEYANDDGRVVSFDHGCGAHSEAQLRKKQLPPPPPDPVLDELDPVEMETF